MKRSKEPLNCLLAIKVAVLITLSFHINLAWGQGGNIAGYDFVGTTSYPNDGLVNAGKIELEQDILIACGFTNRAGTLAWYGTNTSPGRIIKVDLSNLQKVETLVLEEGDDFLSAAVIDGDERYGYFGTKTEPGKIIKIDLETMKRVGEITLPEGEGNLETAIVNPNGTTAYFGTYSAPAHIVEIDLMSFSRTRGLLLPANESLLISGVADAAGQFGYFGSQTIPAKIVKVDLSNLTRVDSVSFTGYIGPRQGVIEPAGVYLYYCLSTPAGLVRLDLANFGDYDILNLPAGQVNAVSLLINGGGTEAHMGLLDGRFAQIGLTNFLYKGVHASQGPGTVDDVPVALRPADLPNTAFVAHGGVPGAIVRVNFLPLERSEPLLLEDESHLSAAIVDHDGRYAYYATDSVPPRVVKIDLERMKRVQSRILRTDVLGVLCSAIDGGDLYGYFGTRGNATSGTALMEVNLDSLYVDRTLTSDLNGYSSIAFDESANRGWLGTRTTNDPSRIRVRSFDPSKFAFGTKDYDVDSNYDGNLTTGIYNTLDGKPLFGSSASPATLFRFDADLSNRTAKTLPAGFTHLNTLVRHPINGRIYAGFGAEEATTGGVFAIEPNSFDFVYQNPGASTHGGVYSGAILPDGDAGLFTTNGALLKINSSLTSIQGDLNLPIDDTPARGVIVSPEGDRAWYGKDGDNPIVGQVNLFPRDQINASKIQLDSPAAIDEVHFYTHAAVGPRRTLGEKFPRGFDVPTSMAFDPESGVALFGTAYDPG
ncbi:MAG: hypothetical protein KC931_15355, partial [Candidatus Omnitrophica bacterium]|nr:hypothetical protein [Candidatus Omnitrophota bacterium]